MFAVGSIIQAFRSWNWSKYLPQHDKVVVLTRESDCHVLDDALFRQGENKDATVLAVFYSQEAYNALPVDMFTKHSKNTTIIFLDVNVSSPVNQITTAQILPMSKFKQASVKDDIVVLH